TPPRPSSGDTDASGSFSIGVDPGTFVVSVRPPNASSFPWKVLPDVLIDKDHDLGTLAIDVPVILAGRILDPSLHPLPQTAIAAWVPSADGTSAVQIGETVTDGDGAYWLALSPSFTP